MASECTPPQCPYLANGLRDPQVTYPEDGEAILLRLPFPIVFGARSILSSTAVTGANSANYHLCFVTNADPNRSSAGGIDLKLFVCPGFSGHDPRGNKFILSLPDDWQATFLPLPFDEQVPPVTPLPTPAGFGAPLDPGGFVGKKPTFLNVFPVHMVLRCGQAFKRFNPPRMLPTGQIRAITVYARGLPTPDIPMVIVPTNDGNPDPTGDSEYTGVVGPSGLSGSPTGNPANPVNGSTPSGNVGTSTYAKDASVWFPTPENVIYVADSDCGDSSDGDGDSGDFTFLEFARLLAPQNLGLQAVVDKHEAKEQAMRSEWVMDWMNGL